MPTLLKLRSQLTLIFEHFYLINRSKNKTLFNLLARSIKAQLHIFLICLFDKPDKKILVARQSQRTKCRRTNLSRIAFSTRFRFASFYVALSCFACVNLWLFLKQNGLKHNTKTSCTIFGALPKDVILKKNNVYLRCYYGVVQSLP